ncbi:MAG TPA: hypothetical protein VII01_05580 [Solirubrobacteraceae bacterium]
MSQAAQSEHSSEIEDAETVEAEGEILDAVPVISGPRVLGAQDHAGLAPERRAAVLPAVQAAAVAAGGFVAGAAVVGLVHRHNRRSQLVKGRRGKRGVGRGAARGGRGVELAQVLGSRSFLVDVHLLGGSGADR